VDGPLSSEQEKQISFIRRSAEDLTELVNDLLDLAKLEAGKIVVHPAPFHVDNLFGALRGMLKPLVAANSTVDLIFEDPTHLPVMETDEGKVSQILRNFISNALKYTQKGEVRISANLIEDHSIAFSVSDTGIGIVKEDQERIFEEFTQLESIFQARFRGTGLGLPLARKLAGLLGGNIRVESKLGIGSVFYANLPLIYRLETGGRAVA
jgi:signal transduction histidine kinase